MRILLVIITSLFFGCSSLPMIDAPSANHNSRVNYLVIHFTSEHFAESLRLLTQRTDSPVSSHYLVPEPGDETYSDGRLRIHRLVEEDRRAWHAGRSYWAGAESLNNNSIGIEIVNRSACVDDSPDTKNPVPEDQTCSFLEYPEEQLDLVVGLVTDILERYPDIDPVDVIGHADIAPGRRVDPGPLFPWQRLYDHGIGAWYDDATARQYRMQFATKMPSIHEVQIALGTYGYKIEPTGENDVQTRFVVRAFQMHYRPTGFSGQVDAETAAILFALNDKYRPDASLQ
ncbi:MAG: N-acetylmuramoyl-L-alanine amidase [Woeseiaceae bacterium]